MFHRSGIRYRSLFIGVGMVAFGLAAHAILVLAGGAALTVYSLARGIGRRRDPQLDKGFVTRR